MFRNRAESRPRLDVVTAVPNTQAMNKPSERQLRRVVEARGRARWVKRLFAAVVWLGCMAVVVIASAVGVAALKPFALGFTVGFTAGTFATFIFLGRRAFPPDRRKLRWWAVAAVAVLTLAAFSWLLAFLFVGIAEAAVAYLAVSREDWLPFDVAELIQTEECPDCAEPRLHTARVCRRCGYAFDASAQTDIAGSG